MRSQKWHGSTKHEHAGDYPQVRKRQSSEHFASLSLFFSPEYAVAKSLRYPNVGALKMWIITSVIMVDPCGRCSAAGDRREVESGKWRMGNGGKQLASAKWRWVEDNIRLGEVRGIVSEEQRRNKSSSHGSRRPPIYGGKGLKWPKIATGTITISGEKPRNEPDSAICAGCMQKPMKMCKTNNRGTWTRINADFFGDDDREEREEDRPSVKWAAGLALSLTGQAGCFAKSRPERAPLANPHRLRKTCDPLGSSQEITPLTG